MANTTNPEALALTANIEGLTKSIVRRNAALATASTASPGRGILSEKESQLSAIARETASRANLQARLDEINKLATKAGASN